MTMEEVTNLCLAFEVKNGRPPRELRLSSADMRAILKENVIQFNPPPPLLSHEAIGERGSTLWFRDTTVSDGSPVLK